MLIATTVKELSGALASWKAEGKQVGLVPTMGALHAGHASLVERSVAENDVTVVSIFVNPTQFNDQNDLATYPRTLEADVALLESLGADAAFSPSVQEIYPEPDDRSFDYAPMHVMEGPRRPGHFNGVCQIVSKLFQLVQPSRAYFGEKDFQQIAVIRAMVANLKLPVEIRPCPIVREPSGLALSSRNTLLAPRERELAANINRILLLSRDYAATHTVTETHDLVVDTLNAIAGFSVEYFDIANADTLQSIDGWDEAAHVVGCITVRCGEKGIRLIDNMQYK